MRLLLHDYDKRGDQPSPFAEGLSAVAETGQLLVACPYIGLSVLQVALARVDRFRIVTDLDAWLTIIPTSQARHDLAKWWIAHRHAIRHQSMLHAKVFIGRGAAMLGSANCTDAGFSCRNEAGVWLDEPDAVADLTAWFERTWIAASELDDASVAAAIQEPCQPIARNRPATRNALLDNAPPRIGRQPSGRTRTIRTTEDAESVARSTIASRVSNCLRLACDRTWAEQYFDWLADLIRALGVQPGDRQFTTTLISRDRRIGVNVNNRSSLAWDKFSPAGHRKIYYLLPAAYADGLVARVPHAVHRVHHLRAYRGETDPPVLLISAFPPPSEFGPEFRETLFAAARAELARARLHSPQGALRHVPLLYEMAVDRSVRDEVFDVAFSPIGAST